MEADDPPMLLATRSGLCNRLRAVLSWHCIARAQRRRLVVLWRADHECNGLFTDVFEPLDGTTFVVDWPEGLDGDGAPSAIDFHVSATRLESRSVVVTEGTCSRSVHGQASVKGRRELEQQCFAVLAPLPSVHSAVCAAVDAIRPFAAVHVRRTDALAVRRAQHTPDADFDTFLEGCDAGLRVYVATDNARRRRRCARSTASPRVARAHLHAGEHGDAHRCHRTLVHRHHLSLLHQR